jgi:hypothetical protein
VPLMMFAQSVVDYSGISVSTAMRDAWYSILSWYRGDPTTFWLMAAGGIVLVFFLRKTRRRY